MSRLEEIKEIVEIQMNETFTDECVISFNAINWLIKYTESLQKQVLSRVD